jgi:DNA-binding transcriptional LysR family regulator
MNLSRIDLNLLVAFDALFRERSVTRAAARVGLSQPAMSNALGRLRVLFGDPLFVRTRGGMAPTVRAKAVSERTRQALAEIRSALEDTHFFNPTSSTREFKIATTDYFNVTLLPRLVRRLGAIAPNIRLRLSQLSRGGARVGLQSGELDLGIAWRLEEAPFDSKYFYTKALLKETMVCIVRQDHPTVRDRLTLAQFLKLDHVVASPVSPSDHYILSVDRDLAHRGLRRRAAVLVPEPSASPFVVTQTDMVASIPGRLARIYAGMVPIRIFAFPFPIPTLTLRLLWHERSQTDPAHRWIRKLLTELGSEL